MDDTTAKALREPFAPGQVGHKPKLSCTECSNARSRNCDKHQKRKCAECGNWISAAHVHLDYVGHAAVTDRLLAVDPEWNWEPVPDPASLGLPVGNGGMWIRLTIDGTTRLGYGDGASIKEVIGDAIRNAAMRFGVALDLWSKETLHGSADEEQPAKPATDPEWVHGWRQRVSAAADASVLRGLWGELASQGRMGLVSEADRDPLAEHWINRQTELQTGAPSARPEPDGAAITTKQSRALHTLFGACGWNEREDKLRACSVVAGRRLGSTSELTVSEAGHVIDLLQTAKDHTDPQVRLGELLEQIRETQ